MRSLRATTWGFVVSLLLIGAGPVTSKSAATPDVGPSEVLLAFEPATPGTATTFTFRATYRSPAGATAKPPALQSLLVDAPEGTLFATGTTPVCPAGDLEFRLLGQAACPAASQVGSGRLSAITGLGPLIDPVNNTLAVYNTGQGVVSAVLLFGLPVVIATDRVAIHENVLEAHPPPVPGGPPDFRTAVGVIEITYPASTGFVTTPPTCPETGQWEYAATIGFADGTTQLATGSIACG